MQVSHYLEDQMVTTEPVSTDATFNSDMARSNSFRIDVPSKSLKNFHKDGTNLQVVFSNGFTVTLTGFFRGEHTVNENIVVFTDIAYSASEIHEMFESRHSQDVPQDILTKGTAMAREHYLLAGGRIKGEPLATAVLGETFTYHFTLDKSFAEDSKVKVMVNDKELPPWLQLKQLGGRKYLLIGSPAGSDIGQMDVQIVVEG